MPRTILSGHGKEAMNSIPFRWRRAMSHPSDPVLTIHLYRAGVASTTLQAAATRSMTDSSSLDRDRSAHELDSSETVALTSLVDETDVAD